MKDDKTFRWLVYPQNVSTEHIQPSESVSAYLSKCRRHILAEFWALFSSKIDAGFPSWRDAQMERKEIVLVGDGSTNIRAEGEDEDELNWNLVLHRNQLSLLIPKKDSHGRPYLKPFTGQSVHDPFQSGGDHFLHTLGYVRPYILEITAIDNALRRKPTALLQAVASPAQRAPFAYRQTTPCDPNSSGVPINQHQQLVLSRFGSVLEGIQGPPGTGKSTTIFHILKSKLPPDYRAVVTCMQNRALDSIAEKLCMGGFPFVVLGHESRLGETARRHTLEAQVQRDQGILKSASLLRAVERLKMRNPWLRLWRKSCLAVDPSEHRAAVLKASNSIQGQARAFLCTIDSLASVSLPIGAKKWIAIVDEAGTVPEYKLPFLLEQGAQALVMIGDQNQLPPFSHQSESARKEGFFQRLSKATAIPMLREQYRMHPLICSTVSRLFYANDLQTTAARAHSSSGGIAWMDYDGRRAENGLSNSTEVGLISSMMGCTIPAMLSAGKTVSIITFYKKQFALLVDAGEAHGLVWAKCDREKNGLFKHPGFRIMTVDAAQGSEADLVILSCVRCNPQRRLGFIADHRRVCVALSRAREQLIVVGSGATLTRSRVWREVWQDCQPGSTRADTQQEQ